MVAFVGLYIFHDLYQGKNVIQGSNMQFYFAQEMLNILQFVFGILNGDPPNDAVDLVPL